MEEEVESSNDAEFLVQGSPKIAKLLIDHASVGFLDVEGESNSHCRVKQLKISLTSKQIWRHCLINSRQLLINPTISCSSNPLAYRQ